MIIYLFHLKLPSCPANTSQLHSVTVSLDIKIAYRALNNLTSCSHLGLVHFPAPHVRRMPTSRNPEFWQQDWVKTNRTVPVVWIHSMIYSRTHQILQCQVCSVSCALQIAKVHCTRQTYAISKTHTKFQYKLCLLYGFREVNMENLFQRSYVSSAYDFVW
jgi:hypothetical protein